jgi:hypothetical protein
MGVSVSPGCVCEASGVLTPLVQPATETAKKTVKDKSKVRAEGSLIMLPILSSAANDSPGTQ